jgi:hypothetical protein
MPGRQQDIDGKRNAVTPEDDLLADVEFDLIDESDPPPEESEDVFARETAIPAAPPEQTAAEAMLQTESNPARPPMDTVDDQAFTPPPARPRHLTPATLEPPASEDLEFDSFDAPIDVFGHPLPGTANVKPNFGQSEVPTAPPVGKKSPRPHPQPSPLRAPVPDKLTQPANQRARPAFLAETARNRPPSPEILARATPQNPRGARPPKSDPTFDIEPVSEPPLSDSALEFVQGLPPVAPSVKPVGGKERAAPPPVSARAGVRELEECYAVGDYSRALQIAEQMLARSPDDLAARRYAQNCRDVLTQMFAARIGPLDQVITVVVSPQEIQWLSLDHRAGFLLSLVDGMSTVDEILDISGMTRLDALKILHDLTEQQVVKLA